MIGFGLRYGWKHVVAPGECPNRRVAAIQSLGTSPPRVCPNRRVAVIHSLGTSPAMATAAKRLVLVVAVALFNGEGRVLIAQRPEGKSMAGLWEFPGGKVDDGETPEQALVRELAEELNIQVEAGDLHPITFASHAYDSFHLLMPLYGCKKWKGQLQGLEGQQMAWVLPSELHNSYYPMPPADIPLIPQLPKFMDVSDD